jgi:hypothetical protein
VDAQHRMLVKKLEGYYGYYGYYGTTGNFSALAKLHYLAECIWRKALARRSQQTLPWEKMKRILKRFPLSRPHIDHRHGT